MWGGRLLLALCLWLCLGAGVTLGAKPKAKPAATPKAPQYNALMELLTDYAERACKRIAPDIRKWKKDVEGRERRCDLFLERVEVMGVGQGDYVTTALKKTSSQVLRIAQSVEHQIKMRKFIDGAAEYTLRANKPTEKEIDDLLLKDFNQWFLDIAVQDKPRDDPLSRLTPQAIDSLRRQGVGIDSYINDQRAALENDDEDEDL